MHRLACDPSLIYRKSNCTDFLLNQVLSPHCCKRNEGRARTSVKTVKQLPYRIIRDAATRNRKRIIESSCVCRGPSRPFATKPGIGKSERTIPVTPPLPRCPHPLSPFSPSRVRPPNQPQSKRIQRETRTKKKKKKKRGKAGRKVSWRSDRELWDHACLWMIDHTTRTVSLKPRQR